MKDVIYCGSVDDAQGEVHILVRRNMLHLDVVETGTKGESFTSNTDFPDIGLIPNTLRRTQEWAFYAGRARPASFARAGPLLAEQS